MIVYIVIALVACAISPISAQNDQIFDGACPNVAVKANFNETGYKGHWYEIKRFENSFITGGCSYPKYDLVKAGHFKVDFLTTNLADKKNTTTTFELKKNTTVGNYDVYLTATTKETVGYKVVDTDYESYSVVFGCANTDNKKHIERVSIYSRSSTLAKEPLAKAMDALKKNKLNSTYLTDVEQDNKKCGRNSATGLVIPTIFTSIMAMLLTKKF